MNMMKFFAGMCMAVVMCALATSCNDDKETDRFMVRYTVMGSTDKYNVTYIDYQGDALTVEVKNQTGTFVREIGPVPRGFHAGITAGTPVKALDCKIEVALNGGAYQTKKQGISPLVYPIE